MFADRLPVTDHGVVVPKAWFGDAKEVALRQENGHVVLEPIGRPDGSEPSPRTGSIPADDPLWRLCEDPVDDDITDASVNLDKYLYGNNE